MKNILLTGSTGFVGQAFVQSAIGRANLVIYKRGSKISDLPWTENMTVLHLAGRAHDKGAKWQDFLSNNIELTQELLSEAKKNKANHFIFMSSAKVYGEYSQHPFLEEDPLRPESDYGKSKMLAEEAVKASGLSYTIFRPPLIWAPHAKGNLQSLKEISRFGFPLPSNIHNARSLVDLNYLIDVLWRSIEGKLTQNQIYNVSNMTKSSSEIFQLMGVKTLISYPSLLLKCIPSKMQEKLLKDLVIDTSKLKQHEKTF